MYSLTMKTLKIVLLEPEQDLYLSPHLNKGGFHITPPLWALSIGTYLKKEIPNADLKILDCRIFPKEKLEDWIKKNKPEIAGISPKFVSYGHTLEAARLFKKYGAKVVLGGPHAANLKKEILFNRGLGSGDYCVDAVIKEDGEKAFCEYVSGKPPGGINNLIWREGEIIRENKTELLDLNSLPVADRDLFDVRRYLKNSDTLLVVSQKGCSWREKSGGCLFCSEWKNIPRFREPSKVWEEIDFLRKKYNVGTIFDCAGNFLNDLNWVKEFWKTSRNYKNKPRFKILNRVDSIDGAVVRMLRGIGVCQLILGIESGTQESLSAFRKGITPKMVKAKVRLLHEYGIQAFHCFVLGAPGETEETINESLEFAEGLARMPATIGLRFHPLVPLPGSLAWKMLREKTGKKYLGKDFIDWKEAAKDWVINFCKVDLRIFNNKLKEAKTRFSFPRLY